MVLLKFIENFRFDKRKDGWGLEEDVVTLATLRLDSLLREGESSLAGYTIRERDKEDAEEKGVCAGQLQAEWMLEHQDKIPVEWRSFYLVFTGTVWCSPGGNPYVSYMFWGSGEWHLRWVSFGRRDRYDDNFCLVRLGK
jgi:hypothetical protein